MAEAGIVNETETQTERPPVVAEVEQVFADKQEELNQALEPEKLSIYRQYRKEFQEHVLANMTEEEQGKIRTRLADFRNKLGAGYRDASIRVKDLVRNTTSLPYVLFGKGWPKGENYEHEIARAKAWGDLTDARMRMRLEERKAYQDSTLATFIKGTGKWALAGGVFGAIPGGVAAIPAAAVGAAVGGTAEVAYSKAQRVVDKIFGPPISVAR
ncbi:hypothetical protein A2Z33_03525 [Candidatus Gottesmanbacteria bacterium RBG_16_52_11]|uniref:Uncharacterized protein n=1 Tax=Candidatus Gottesmanbacteria bacterium RBG_16_52_11 TaxID=1798374 RepID=A0A1F5YW51_9BACT|nr:MAG: hypothetical protein A2Z33_03525 [Candidatus Gottesmanbacteria bacterium RBG_16_52_11]